MTPRLGDSHRPRRAEGKGPGSSIAFLVDTGATYSVLASHSSPTDPSPISVTGWTGPLLPT